MEQPLDLEQLKARFEIVRHSEYFPAILGAVAGGLTGAMMAGLISNGRRTNQVVVEDGSTADKGIILGFSAKDLLQLATVVTSLARQLREWRAA
jgi:hypothetical protein